jgi:hypothetical protein
MVDLAVSWRLPLCQDRAVWRRGINPLATATELGKFSKKNALRSGKALFNKQQTYEKSLKEYIVIDAVALRTFKIFCVFF